MSTWLLSATIAEPAAAVSGFLIRITQTQMSKVLGIATGGACACRRSRVLCLLNALKLWHVRMGALHYAYMLQDR